MKVAMGMQKQITAKRGQIDALQSKIQFLEEAMTNANKVSPCPRSGGSQHVHSLIYFMTERHSRDTNYSGEKKRGYFWLREWGKVPEGTFEQDLERAGILNAGIGQKDVYGEDREHSQFFCNATYTFLKSLCCAKLCSKNYRAYENQSTALTDLISDTKKIGT